MASNPTKLSGKARDVANNVCGATGHLLQSFPLQPLVDRKVVQTKTSNYAVDTKNGNAILGEMAINLVDTPTLSLIPQFELRCAKCTLTPKEIETLRDRGNKKSALVEEVAL